MRESSRPTSGSSSTPGERGLAPGPPGPRPPKPPGPGPKPNPIAGWNAFFLITTILTSVTGYFFPIKGLTPAHIVGAISLVLLAVALFAIYGKKLAGRWRATYVVTAVAALWLNFFVAIAQSFNKFAFLNKFAPTGSEPPFAITQGIVLILFIILGIAAVRRYRPVD